MLFTQGRFFLFFLLVFAVHWSLRTQRARKLWLLALSYAFYALCAGRFLALLLVLTLATGLATRAMGRHAERRGRRPWLVFGLGVGLYQLGVFKYHDFLVRSLAEGLSWIGIELRPAMLDLALPLGISFFTFQTLSYVIDVYRGRLAPVRDPLDFALFVAFFPTLLAGPILRGTELLPQLAEPRSFARDVHVRPLLVLLLVGFFKKACVADGIAAVVAPVFEAPLEYTRASAWLAVALYHLQIYCDFSGYSDMAIACAGFLGYRLSQNFAFPYFARGIGDFWRRWHVSLSSWMRDYVYLPLAGKRPGVARRMVVLLATLSLCGLWHGAGWRFVLFGALHGTYLVIEELWKQVRPDSASARRLAAFLGWPVVTLVVLLSWPVFQIPSLATTGALLQLLIGLRTGGATALATGAAWFLPLFALVHWLAYRGTFRRLYRDASEGALRLLFPLGYGLAWSVALAFVATRTVPFIYFQF